MAVRGSVVVKTSVSSPLNNGTDTLRAIQTYDADNNYPNRVENAIAASGTATDCVELFRKHLKGKGFSNADLNALVMNEQGQTLLDLHEHLLKDASVYNRGFAIWIGYNAMLEIVELKVIPYSHCRLGDGKEDLFKIAVYKDWGPETYYYSKNINIRYCDEYNPDQKIIKDQISKAKNKDGVVTGAFDDWNGQILWSSHVSRRDYAPAIIDPVFTLVLTERALNINKYRKGETGFMASHMMTIPFQTDVKSLTSVQNTVRSFQGADQSNKVLIMETDYNPDGKPLLQLTPLNNSAADGEYEYTETSSAKAIIRRYQQHARLHGYEEAGKLGGSNDFAEAEQLYDRRIGEYREYLAKIWFTILENWHQKLPFSDSDFVIIPVSGIQAEAKKAPLAAMLGAGGTQELVAVITNPLLGYEEKLANLELVFGLSPEDAERMVSKNKTQPENGNNPVS